MIKSATDPIWEKLIRGELNITVKEVPAQMMLSRCKRNLEKNPDPENIKKLKAEAHAFFTKFENILQDEIKQLFG